MDIRHLSLLRELAERGSITAVAQATHRTPSAVSQQLKTAQREFGVPLIEPAGRGIQLTDAGKLLAEAGSTVAIALEQAQARFDDFRGEPVGTVSIAALPSAATFLLPRTFTTLAETAISLRCSDFDLAETEFAGLTADNDIVIAHSLTSIRPAGTGGLTVVPLAREPLDIAMAADHPLAEREAVRPEDLVECAWIGVPRGFPFDTVLQAIEQATGAELTVGQRLRDNRLIESLVAHSDHLAVLPRFTTPTDDRLVLCPIQEIPAARHVSAVLRPDRAERRAVQQVVRTLQHVASEVEQQHA